MKATLFGLVGFAVFSIGWGWYYLRPAAEKAIGANAVRAAFTANPLYWALAFTAALGGASLYVLAHK